MYATKLERGPGVLPEIVDDGASMLVEGDGSVLPMGWAFKSAGVQRKNLTVAQKKLSDWSLLSWRTHWAKSRSNERLKGNANSKA